MRARALAAALGILLLAVAIGGWAFALGPAATDDGAGKTIPILDRLPGRSGADADRVTTPGGPEQVAAEPGVGDPAPAKRPLVVQGDDALRELAAQHGHGGDGTTARPFLFEGKSLAETGADAIRIRDTRLPVIVQNLRLEGDGGGVALHLANVTHVTLRAATITGQHTAVQIESAASIRIEDVDFTGNRVGLHAAAVTDLQIEASRFVGNTHGVLVAADLDGRPAASARIALTGNNFTALAPGPGTDALAGSGVVLPGSDHRVAGNTFAGHAPGGLRMTGSRLLVEENGFLGGPGRGLILTATTDAVVRGNTFLGHAQEAALSFDAQGLIVEGNTWKESGDGAFASVRDVRARITGNEFSGPFYGVSVWDGSDVQVDGNVFTVLEHGIRVYAGKDVRVHGNDATYVGDTVITAIGTEGLRVSENRAHGPARLGVYLGGTTDARIEGNTIGGAGHGIVVHGDAEETKLIGNRVSGAGLIGIRLATLLAVEVRENTIRNFDQGIRVETGAHGVVFRGGAVYWSAWGLLIDGDGPAVRATGMEITNSNVAAAVVVGGAGHVFESMSLARSGIGLFLTDARQVTLTGSHVEENRIGMQFANSTQNLVYNNVVANDFFPGDQNVILTKSPRNAWNVSRTPGPNILGGPWIAGNFWHDYGGQDANQDGLGDVPHQPIPYDEALEEFAQGLGLPMGPFDWYPLVVDGGGPPLQPPVQSPAPGSPTHAMEDDRARDDGKRPGGRLPGPGSAR